MTSIHHFRRLDDRTRREVFSVAPEPVSLGAPARAIGEALGAVAYVPAIRDDLAGDLERLWRSGAQAVVIDLEDSVPADERASVLGHVDAALVGVGPGRCPPAVFLRPADAAALTAMVDGLSADGAARLAGVVLPKVARANVTAFLHARDRAEQRWGRRVLSMPVLESHTIADARTRAEELRAIHTALVAHADSVAAVRIGATDLGGAFGIRRDGIHTVYQVAAIAAAIGDIVSTFAAVHDSPIPVAGPVWEHFAATPREACPIDLSRRREVRDRGASQRRDAIQRDVMIAEVLLDRANGLVGKTVIHPSHVALVHALHAVEGDEYADAREIVAAGSGGVARAQGSGRMNEYSPHRPWARATLRRARTFGVLRDGVGYGDVVAAEGACA